MRAGQLRHKITIEQLDTSTADAMGAAVKIWTLFCVCWARVQPVSGKEFFNANQERAQISHKIRIRYVAEITPAHRVNFGGRLFNIQTVINFDERNRELEILAVEIV